MSGNKKMNKTHVITTEFVITNSMVCKDGKFGDKVFKDQSDAISYADKYLKSTPKDCKRTVDIFTVSHVRRQTINRLSKKKGVWVAKD